MISVFVRMTIAYLLGMIMAVQADFGAAALFSACILLVLAVRRLLRKASAAQVLCGASLLAGVVLMSVAWNPASSAMEQYIDRYIELRGVICEVPDEHGDYYSYVLELENLVYLDNSAAQSGKVRVTSEIRLDTGNRVAVRGFLQRLDGPDNSTEFDYSTYYKSKNIHFCMHADEAELIAPRAFLASLPYLGEYIKSRITFAINRYFTGDSAAVMKAVLIGNKSEFSESFKKTLKKTSAIRFLYPSYLRIFLLLSLCELIFAGFKRKKRQSLFLIVLAVYAAMNSNFYTLIRAALMLAFGIIYRRKRGFAHYPDLAAAVILLMLVSNPLLIFSSGFVMSVSAGIIMHNFLRPLSGGLTFIRNKNLRSTVAVWLAGTVGMMPLSAYYFNGAPMYSVIFTLAYIPLVIALCILAPVVLVMYELFGNAWILGILCDGLLTAMQKLPQMVAMLPGHYITIGRTTVLGFAICISFAVVLKLWLERRWGEKLFKAAAGTFLVLMTVHTVSVISDVGNMYVSFINVGQGDGAVIEVKGRDTILIDGGGGSGELEYNIGENVFLPYLSAKGIFRIDLAVVSHYHRDHCEGIIAAIENLQVHSVLMPDVMPESEYRTAIIKAAEEHGTKIFYAAAGDRLEFTSGMVMEVLSPPANYIAEDENDTSMALKITYGGKTMFFGGDMTAEAEKNILGRVGKVDILKASHHGSKTSSSEGFVQETAPEFAVFCVGEDNSYGHPSPMVTQRYKDAGAKILRTDLMGDIVIKCSKNGDISADWFKEESEWR